MNGSAISPSKSFILETINEKGNKAVKKSGKLVTFPSFNLEAFQKSIKVELDHSGFNCDKFDFINSQLCASSSNGQGLTSTIQRLE
jgi:hypothetical protein